MGRLEQEVSTRCVRAATWVEDAMSTVPQRSSLMSHVYRNTSTAAHEDEEEAMDDVDALPKDPTLTQVMIMMLREQKRANKEQKARDELIAQKLTALTHSVRAAAAAAPPTRHRPASRRLQTTIPMREHRFVRIAELRDHEDRMRACESPLPRGIGYRSSLHHALSPSDRELRLAASGSRRGIGRKTVATSGEIPEGRH